MKIAYLFLNGELLGEKDFFIKMISEQAGDLYCADGGANTLEKFGLTPNEIWGDLDSISNEILKNYEAKGVIIKVFPKDKNFTDTELLLDYLYQKKYDKIVVVNGLGGRKDHELTNLNLIFKYKNLSFITGKEKIFLIDKYTKLSGIKGATVSFIPFSKKITNLTLKGFKYPLLNYTLFRGETICMSNVVTEESCEIFFETGELIGIINF